MRNSLKTKPETRTFRPSEKSGRIIREAEAEGLRISAMINALIVKHGQKYVDELKGWR